MATASVGFRTGTADDAPGLVEGYDWLFAPPGLRPPDWDPQQAEARLRRVLTSSRSGAPIAEADGSLVGFCTVYIDIESVRFGQRAWIEDLAVDPRYRSLGIGKELLDRAKQWARDRGARRIELESAASRIDAHRFYEREAPAWRSACFGWEL